MLDKVRVGGIDYKVELKDLSTRKDEEDGLQLGWCVFKEDLIEINENLTTARQHQTFIHELMHAIFYEAGLEQDEDTVNRIGLVLYQVLKDNDFSWIGKPQFYEVPTKDGAVKVPIEYTTTIKG